MLPVPWPPANSVIVAGEGAASARASSFIGTAAALTSTVSAALPGSSLTPTVAGLLSSTIKFVTSLDLKPLASALIEYVPGVKEVKANLPSGSEVAVFAPTGPTVVTLALTTTAPDESRIVPPKLPPAVFPAVSRSRLDEPPATSALSFASTLAAARGVGGVTSLAGAVTAKLRPLTDKSSLRDFLR